MLQFLIKLKISFVVVVVVVVLSVVVAAAAVVVVAAVQLNIVDLMSYLKQYDLL